MKALKNTIAEMGVSLGCYSAATLTLGTVTLIGSLAFQGVIWVGNGLERIEKPVQRVGIMSGLIIGASAVGYILGAAMSGVGTREDLIAKEVSLERMEKELKLERERSAFIRAGREHQENYLKAQIEEKDRTIKQEIQAEIEQEPVLVTVPTVEEKACDIGSAPVVKPHPLSTEVAAAETALVADLKPEPGASQQTELYAQALAAIDGLSKREARKLMGSLKLQQKRNGVELSTELIWSLD